MDDRLLHAEVAGRDLLWFTAVMGTVLAAARGMIGEENKVRRSRLKHVFAPTGQDFVRLASLTRCLCVILCDLTTCHFIESACFQRLMLKCDEPLSNFAFNFNLRRYDKVFEPNRLMADVVAHTHYLPRHWRNLAHNQAGGVVHIILLRSTTPPSSVVVESKYRVRASA
jgi:hypothetical protein